VLTHLRIFAVSAAALCVVGIGQAFAFWPFAGPVRMSLAPAYGGVCEACDLSGRILVGARMSNSNFNRSNFSDAVLTRADATGSDFAEADFTGADLRNAKLIEATCPRAIFENAQLANADARRADFRHADFTRADVTRMNFGGADIAGADLRNAAGLTQSQLNAACGDRLTRVPRGMRVRSCEQLTADADH
jgi:uncharacterized protein YjbI with pentapeptide repeats